MKSSPGGVICRTMGKKAKESVVAGTRSEHEQVCRTLIEVLRAASPQGVPISQLHHIYHGQGRGNFCLPNGKGLSLLQEACRHPPYCNYFDVSNVSGLAVIRLKPGKTGGSMASSPTMPQSGGGGAGCPSPKPPALVIRVNSPSPSSASPSPRPLPTPPPSSGPPPIETLMVDGAAAYRSLERMLQKGGRPSMIGLVVNRRTRQLLLMLKAALPSASTRIVMISESAVAGAIAKTPLGGLLRDQTLIKATHDMYEGLASLPLVLSTAASVLNTQLLGELLGHPHDVRLKALLADGQTGIGEADKADKGGEQQVAASHGHKTHSIWKGKAVPRIDPQAELLDTLESILHAFPTRLSRLNAEQRRRLAAASCARLQTAARCVDGLRPVVYVPSTGRLGSAELWPAVAPSQPIMVQDVQPLLRLIPAELIGDMAGVSSDAFTMNVKEFVLDVGQRPRAKLFDRREHHFLHSDPMVTVTSEHLAAMLTPLSIGHDDRAGIDGTLHRISVMKNREGAFTGATLRVGRHVTGNMDCLRDLLTDKPHALDSILFLGVPGSGKTTLIREVARVLSEELSIEVLIIDTSNEIAGDGDVAHRSVGASRRMMVQSLGQQASVMIRGLQNHTPEVMIIDEIGRKAEAVAASTIKERGVAVIGSAHGDFEKLFRNNELRDLLGGSMTVVLGDDTAKQTNAGNKVQTRRARDPVFDVIIELKPDQLNEWIVYRDMKAAVDAIYARRPIQFEKRVRDKATNKLSVAYGERMYKSMFDEEGPN